MSTENEILRLTAVEMASKVRDKSLSPSEILDAVFDRIEGLDSTLHAFCTLSPEAARADARAVEKAVMAGDDPGAMAGVPVGIKDLIATEGIRTVGGSAAYRDFVPDVDDVTVERVRRAGGLRVGKTNVPEFGYSGVGHNPVFETTRNPWNPELTPGGSSAGSGAAVAAGMVPVALGSDGGGSVRIPAAHCGLVGFKASMGRVPLYPGCRDPRYPGMSSWESLEHIGPMTRTVSDTALLFKTIAGPDARDRHSIPVNDIDWDSVQANLDRPLRVAYSEDLGYAAVDPEVRAIVRTAIKRLESDLGWSVDAVDPGWSDPYDAFWGVVARDTDLAGMRDLAREHPMSPHLRDFLNRPWSAEMLTSASMARQELCNRMAVFMQDYDLLVTPTLTVPPFPVHMQGPEKVEGRMVDPFAWLSFTLPFNFTGSPAVSLPAGWTEGGLPVGVQFVGGHLADELVLRAAAAYESTFDWRARWPEEAH